MVLDINFLIAASALIFSFYQQLQINKICEKCPYFPPNKK
jgi:hypothetical protein